ncbi:MAG: zf-HC2 domain-containing protein [Candidatus Krumholzibacteriota bacterium]
MRCPEFREVMRSFLDGEVDEETRKTAVFHLAECADCAARIEDKHFWDDAIRTHLDHELPAGLREDILGDLDHLSGRDQWRVVWWVIRRDLSRPRQLLQTAAVAAVLILAVTYLPVFRSNDEHNGAFEHAGPIVQVGEETARQPGEPEPTARLTLSGRMI